MPGNGSIQLENGKRKRSESRPCPLERFAATTLEGNITPRQWRYHVQIVAGGVTILAMIDKYREREREKAREASPQGAVL